MQKISFTTLSTPGLGVRAVAELARRFGYDGVDLRVSGHRGEIMPDAASGDIREVRAILAGEGVAAASLMSYLTYPEDLPPEGLTQSLRGQLSRQLEIAGLLGADAVRVIGGRSQARAYTGELADALLAVRADIGPAGIVIQNHVGAFSAAESLAVVRAVDHPGVSLAFSPDHCVIMGEDLRAVYPALPGRARKLFVSDIDRAGESHSSVLPGQGVVPFLDAYRALGANFDGWVTLKYEKLWEPSLEGPEVSLPYFMTRAPSWFGGWHKV